MYRDILLAIDLAYENSWAAALPAAVDSARHHGATLHLMMVVPDFGMSIVGSFFPEGYEQQAIDKARERLRAFADEHVPEDVEVEVHVGHGRPYEVILASAKRIGADLIVIGPHQPGTEDYFLGSTASRVVRFAKCSVLVVRYSDGAAVS